MLHTAGPGHFLLRIELVVVRGQRGNLSISELVLVSGVMVSVDFMVVGGGHGAARGFPHVGGTAGSCLQQRGEGYSRYRCSRNRSSCVQAVGSAKTVYACRMKGVMHSHTGKAQTL